MREQTNSNGSIDINDLRIFTDTNVFRIVNEAMYANIHLSRLRNIRNANFRGAGSTEYVVCREVLYDLKT